MKSVISFHRVFVLFFGVIFYFLAVNTTLAATIIVNKIADTNDGVCDTDCSLREAVSAANSASGNDIIEFDAGVFNTPQIIHLTSGFQLQVINNGTLTINGTGVNLLTVRGTNQSRIFSIDVGAAATLNGVNLSGSSFSGRGSGIANEGGTLTLNNCKIGGNFSGDLGGGIYNNGTLNLSNTVLIGNLATNGGGGIYNQNGSVTLQNTTISSNSGAGIYNQTGNTLTINNSTIDENSGGGIHNFSGATLNITNSTVSGNSSTPNGGGIRNIGTMTATNVTITQNIAGTAGGGIYNTGTITANNITVNSNYAPSGGGVRSLSQFTVRNSIFGDNTDTGGGSRDFYGTMTSFGYNLVESPFNTTITGIQSGILTFNDAKLGSLTDNGGPTLTCALLLNSPAIDGGDPGSITATDQRGILRPQNGDGTGASLQDIGAYERIFSGTPPFDFDSDGKTDLSVFRPSTGLWFYQLSGNGENAGVTFGNSTDKLVPADFTGDGKTDVAVFRPAGGQWYILRSENSTLFVSSFGLAEDFPAPADFDGDRKADLAVFRPSQGIWYIYGSSRGVYAQQFGTVGDVPVVADYDGDKIADIAIYRPSQGQWWILRSGSNVIATQFGSSNDKPVQGDYTGDGKADIAFWRPADGFWYILRSEDFSFFAFPFGTGGDKPVPGDYDGDAKFDAAVFRPSTVLWFIKRTGSATLIQQFGEAGDQPVPNAFVP